MKQIKKILFPTDFSAMATMGYQYCLNMARLFDAKVDVLHVYRTDFSVPVPEAMGTHILEEKRRAAVLKLGSFAHLRKSNKKNLAEGVEIETHTAIGLPEDAISVYARNNDIDLIIMPTKGEHNVIEVLFGSVTTATVAKAVCPVMVIPEGSSYNPIKNLAYATDLSIENVSHIDTPLKIAKLYGAALHYVHIYSGDKAPEWQIDEVLAANNDDLEIFFHQFKSGSVQGGMQAFLDLKKIDLLMTYSQPKNFFERLFRLSTTRYMIENITTPLLVVR